MDTGITFDPIAHVYCLNGKAFKQSVTELKNTFVKPFPAGMIAQAVAKKEGKEINDILAQWEANKDLSCAFGNAIDLAVRYWIDYGEEPKHPFLKGVVQDFAAKCDRDVRKANIVVYDEPLSLVGTMDILAITGDKKAIIEDVKTNGDITKPSKEKLLPPFDDLPATKINEYRIQLSIYQYLMERRGWTIEGLRLWHYGENGFACIELEPLDVTKIWQIKSL